MTLKNGDTWPLFRVSSKTSKTVAEQRNWMESGRNLVDGENITNAAQEQKIIKEDQGTIIVRRYVNPRNITWKEEDGMTRRYQIGLKG